MEEANRDESQKCLSISQQALLVKDYEKAHRFADKALKLYPTDEVTSSSFRLPTQAPVATQEFTLRQLCISCSFSRLIPALCQGALTKEFSSVLKFSFPLGSLTHAVPCVAGSKGVERHQ